MYPSPLPKRFWLTPGLRKVDAQNAIGEVLYPRIHSRHPKVAGKLTGMLVLGMEIADLDALLDDEAKFITALEQGIQALKKMGVTVE